MDSHEIDIEFLKRQSLFGGIPSQTVEKIKEYFECQEFPEGSFIIREGEPNPRVYFLLSGQVEVLKNQRRLALFNPGDSFGEMEFLDIMPAEASIRALVAVRLASFTGMALHAIYKEEPDAFSLLVLNLARDLSRRLRAIHKELD